MTTLELEDLSVVPLARSAIYGAIASAFRGPGSPLFRSFADAGEADALREAISIAGGSETERLMKLSHAFQDIALSTDGATLFAEFVRLFGHTSRGAAPPYETEYGTGGPFSQPQEMSDISGFFNAFGLELDPSRHERFDHICCELEFMCFLCAKQAHAIEAGDNENTAEIVRSQRIFLRDHLSRFGRTFFFRVLQEADGTWHAAAAELGSTFLDAECHRLEVPIERAYLPLRPDDSFDVPLTCGSCSTACGGDDSAAE